MTSQLRAPCAVETLLVLRVLRMIDHNVTAFLFPNSSSRK
jgi:hypothetical protein